MAEFNILETLDLVGKAKTREEKRQVLIDRDNFATKALLQLNYHPDVKWYLFSQSCPFWLVVWLGILPFLQYLEEDLAKYP